MKPILANLYVILFTLIIPILTPYGYKFISYADPFLLARDYVMDIQKDYFSLRKLWIILLTCLGVLVLWNILSKEKVAVISLVTSMISETIDFLITRRWLHSKFRPFITIFANFLDAVIFVCLAFLFDAIAEFDYNILWDFLVMNILYLMLFAIRYKKNFEPQQ